MSETRALAWIRKSKGKDDDYRFKSSTDNLVCEPSDLWLSYRDD